ncbi:MAG: hypothetical protein M1816_002240 [Peltula sp. TS41687]|nr:MAG: hypothetical protein M1816_002240 [Peltula sp. TS41687]
MGAIVPGVMGLIKPYTLGGAMEEVTKKRLIITSLDPIGLPPGLVWIEMHGRGYGGEQKQKEVKDAKQAKQDDHPSRQGSTTISYQPYAGKKRKGNRESDPYIHILRTLWKNGTDAWNRKIQKYWVRVPPYTAQTLQPADIFQFSEVFARAASKALPDRIACIAKAESFLVECFWVDVMTHDEAQGWRHIGLTKEDQGAHLSTITG